MPGIWTRKTHKSSIPRPDITMHVQGMKNKIKVLIHSVNNHDVALRLACHIGGNRTQEATSQGVDATVAHD